jgi:hypothetical protein
MPFEEQKPESVEVIHGPEDSFYETNPQLTLVAKNADVSYTYYDRRVERHTNIFEDERGTLWYELQHDQRKQMTVALLCQGLFNISTIIEVPQTPGSLSKFFSMLNPKIGSYIDSKLSHGAFLSKKIDLQKGTEKDQEQKAIEFALFSRIFEPRGQDRSFFPSHNYRDGEKSYALFDFDKSNLPTFEQATKDEAEVSSEPIISWVEHWFDFGTYKQPNSEYIIAEVVKKIKNIVDFYATPDGAEFFTSVFTKTKYLEEVNKESYSNQSDIDDRYKGLLVRLRSTCKDMLNELETRQKPESIHVLKELIDSLDKVLA